MSTNGPSMLELAENLALLYLGLAHGGDDNLSQTEKESIVFKLHRWLPDADPALIGHVVRDAMLTYFNGLGGRQLLDIVDTLKTSLSRESRIMVLRDLIDLAKTDPPVTEGEHGFIGRIASRWDLEDQIRPAY